MIWDIRQFTAIGGAIREMIMVLGENRSWEVDDCYVNVEFFNEAKRKDAPVFRCTTDIDDANLPIS